MDVKGLNIDILLAEGLNVDLLFDGNEWRRMIHVLESILFLVHVIYPKYFAIKGLVVAASENVIMCIVVSKWQ